MHTSQYSHSVVLQKTSAASVTCAYQISARPQPLKRKCPWYLSCRPDLEAWRESFGEHLEQGLNELGARGFHIVGIKVGSLEHLMEQDFTGTRRYEFRVISASEGESPLDEAFHEGFRVVTMDGSSGTDYVVMERATSWESIP